MLYNERGRKCKVNRRFVSVVAAITVSSVLLVVPSVAHASQQSGALGGSSRSTKASTLYPLAFVNPASANSYQIAYQCGIVEYAKAEGFNLISVADNSLFSVEAQIPLIQAAAAKSPKALITDPTSPTAITNTLKSVVARGITVALYDNPLANTHVATGDIESDSYSGGVALANYVVKATGGKASILFIEIEPGNLASNQRIVGFESVIKHDPGITTYGPFYDDFTATKDAAIVDAALAAHPHLTMVVPSYNSAADAAYVELKALGKVGKVKMFTFDADPTLVADVRAGTVQAVMSQQPYLQAKDTLIDAREGILGIKHTYLTELPMVMVTPENVNSPSVRGGLYTTKSCM